MKLKIIKVCPLNSRREMGLSKKCCVVYVELVPSAKSSFPHFLVPKYICDNIPFLTNPSCKEKISFDCRLVHRGEAECSAVLNLTVLYRVCIGKII